jgi:hypothetical protein
VKILTLQNFDAQNFALILKNYLRIYLVISKMFSYFTALNEQKDDKLLQTDEK